MYVKQGVVCLVCRDLAMVSLFYGECGARASWVVGLLMCFLTGSPRVVVLWRLR